MPGAWQPRHDYSATQAVDCRIGQMMEDERPARLAADTGEDARAPSKQKRPPGVAACGLVVITAPAFLRLSSMLREHALWASRNPGQP